MKRCRSGLFLLSVVACLTACAAGKAPEGKPPPEEARTPPPPLEQQHTAAPVWLIPSAAPVAKSDGRPVATELPPEIKRLIDGVRRLHEQPGLILDRGAIYKSLGVKPTSLFVPPKVGGRAMSEELAFERPEEYANWRASLKYSEFPESESWSVRVELSYSEGTICYPSRLVESYWGEPFAYRPLGVHAFFDELQRKQGGMSPTGPHDGAPYNADFSSPHSNHANVSFFMGPGGCLITITTSKLFKLKEFSDDRVYHE
jgi:hypothetical protein